MTFFKVLHTSQESHYSGILPIYTETNTRKEGKPHGGRDEGCLITVNLLYLTLQPAQLPSQGCETALPEVIPQPLVGP